MDTATHYPAARPAPRRARLSLAWQIAIGLLIGIATGLVLHQTPAHFREMAVSGLLQPAGDIFVKLVKMVVVPVVFTSMVIGVAGVGDGKTLGRIGLKTLIYFEVITTIAIVIGLIVGNVMQPGAGTDMSQLGHADLTAIAQSTKTFSEHSGVMKILTGIIPDNIFAAMAKGDLLPVIFFSILFGLGLQTLPAAMGQPVIHTLKGISDAMFKVTNIVMHYAPIGVFALIAVTVSTFGFESLLPLFKLVVITYIALIFFALVVLGIAARLFGLRITRLIRHIKDELIIAFSSCSSASVLPQIMKKVEDMGVPKSVSTFVLPTGYSFNLDGASIYLGIGTLFIAQLYGIHLGLQEQIVLTLTMTLTSKGTAGVPGFMLVILLVTLSTAGLPIEGLAFIAGVDRLMDMGRTALNVLGNALAPLIIAKWEGVYEGSVHAHGGDGNGSNNGEDSLRSHVESRVDS
ncbi:C4-dicarboxylate transporter [Pandoraea captiosa]|uniref:C4-dicarboxylate transporter n=1 Tax=Pandoraea captiosa TaxID=2508302 RepID=A0A5E4ZGK8_9BURK|nr:cation:dicarboxylase symporter family transporter [Pandoraea captiosa]VVE60521.1 C4-dicarboxylate transporter [Pandoraea captiosa]